MKIERVIICLFFLLLSCNRYRCETCNKDLYIQGRKIKFYLPSQFIHFKKDTAFFSGPEPQLHYVFYTKDSSQILSFHYPISKHYFEPSKPTLDSFLSQYKEGMSLPIPGFRYTAEIVTINGRKYLRATVHYGNEYFIERLFMKENYHYLVINIESLHCSSIDTTVYLKLVDSIFNSMHVW